MDVYATCYEHECGTDLQVFATYEGAEKRRSEIAAEWWDKEFPDDEAPTDFIELGEKYFQLMGDRCGPAEFLTIQKCKVVES